MACTLTLRAAHRTSDETIHLGRTNLMLPQER